MFGWFKKQAEKVSAARQEIAFEAASQTRQFMMQVEAAIGRMPKEFISDPFVLGVISAHAAITAKVLTSGNCPNLVIENSMITGVQLVLAGSEFSREDAIGALFKLKNHPEYAKATEAVSLVLGAKFGRRDLASDPLVLAARARIQAMPKVFRESFGLTEDDQVAYQLSRDLVVAPIREKYGESWKKTDA